MKKQEFDYYIYIDYSENLIGYAIIERCKIKEILSKITKLGHYKGIKHKKEYLKAIKARFEKEKITDLLFGWKIRDMRLNLEVFTDTIRFISENSNCILFLCIDNKQYNAFMRLIEIVPHERLKVLRESELNKKSLEYRLSIIIDNMLNLERFRRMNL